MLQARQKMIVMTLIGRHTNRTWAFNWHLTATLWFIRSAMQSRCALIRSLSSMTFTSSFTHSSSRGLFNLCAVSACPTTLLIIDNSLLYGSSIIHTHDSLWGVLVQLDWVAEMGAQSVFKLENNVAGSSPWKSGSTEREDNDKDQAKWPRDLSCSGGRKVLMVFIVKCTFLQIVSAPQNPIITFNPYKNYLWKAQKGVIWMS